MTICPKGQKGNHDGHLNPLPPLDIAGGEVENGAEAEDREPQGREVVMQEQLSTHEVEW